MYQFQREIRRVKINDYEGANFTLANGNRNVPLEKLISIVMLCNHLITLNCNQVVEFLVPAEMCTIVLLSTW